MSSRKAAKNVPAKATTTAAATPAGNAAAAGAPATSEAAMPRTFKTILQLVSLAMFPVGAAFATLGIQFIITHDGRFDEPASRVSYDFAYALFAMTAGLLAVVSLSWLFLYGVIDLTNDNKTKTPSLPFAVAMKRFMPTLLGGMWIGHALRLGANLQKLDREYLREWAVAVLATNGPAILLYLRIRAKAAQALAAQALEAQKTD